MGRLLRLAAFSILAIQAALLAHPKFATGDFNTGFIAEHYGKGFAAEDVPHDNPNFLVALAAFVRRKSRARTQGMTSGRRSAGAGPEGSEAAACRGGTGRN